MSIKFKVNPGHITVLVCFSVFAVLLTVFTVLLFRDIQASTVDDVEISANKSKEYVAADVFGVMFVLREQGGQIAVLNSVESTVLEVLDVKADTLPIETRNELAGGMCITSVSELVSVINSFENDVGVAQK